MVKFCFNMMDTKMTLLNLNCISVETYGHCGTKGYWTYYLFAVMVSE